MAHISFAHLLCVLLVHTCHECLEASSIFIADEWFIVNVVIILKYLREHVGNGLALWVSHGIDSSVCTFSHELMLQAVAVAVASDNAADFPEAEIVEELTTGDAYLAHEQLIDVVGGG